MTAEVDLAFSPHAKRRLRDLVAKVHEFFEGDTDDGAVHDGFLTHHELSLFLMK